MQEISTRARYNSTEKKATKQDQALRVERIKQAQFTFMTFFSLLLLFLYRFVVVWFFGPIIIRSIDSFIKSFTINRYRADQLTGTLKDLRTDAVECHEDNSISMKIAYRCFVN